MKNGIAGKIVGYIIKFIISVILIGIFSGIICTGAFAWYVTQYIDTDMDIDLSNLTLNQTSVIYCMDKQTGEYVEYERLFDSENRIWVSIDDIPEDLQNAFIAIEDERFKTHRGVDWKRTLGAVVHFVLPGSGNYGGSTITQQLIKNLTGDDEVRPDRKIKEILRALELEKRYTKKEILETYLNTIFLGQRLNGVQTAANTYFGKDVSELTLAECASIAGITQYPTKYNPLINPENNKTRQEVILNKMLELGMISEQECAKAKAEKLVFKKQQAEEETESAYTYYGDQVFNDVCAALMEQKGMSKDIAERTIYNGGLSIYIAIDTEVQDALDRVFQDEESYPKINTIEQPQASMVVMDPKTGAVLGIAGGRGKKMGNRTLNYATMTYRQPGSSIKPLSVYSPGIEYNIITYGTVMDDTPYDMNRLWPKNQSRKYAGRMTVSRAVELSLNTLPVKIMAELTPQKSFEYMRDNLGFTSLIERRVYGNSVKSDIDISPLALGGLTKGVSVLEMTAAYCTFDNEGIYSKPYTYTKVLDSKGDVLLDSPAEQHVAMSEQTAFITHKLLTNVISSGTGTAARLKSGIPIAGKTGTTDDDYDRWFAGYSPYYVGVVWFGYSEPKTIPSLSVNPALRLWKLVMDEIHEGKEPASFPDAPADVITAQYCMDSGGVPTDACRNDPRGNRIATGWFKKGTQPTEACSVHMMVDTCAESGKLATEFCPEEAHKSTAMLYLPERSELAGKVTTADAQYVINTTLDENGNVVIEGEVCDIHTAESVENGPENTDVNPDDPGQSGWEWGDSTLPPWLGGEAQTPSTPSTPSDPGGDPGGASQPSEPSQPEQPPEPDDGSSSESSVPEWLRESLGL